MIKFKKNFISLLLIIVSIFTFIFFPIKCKIVNAEEDDGAFDTLYYFSDNVDSLDYKEMFLELELVDSVELTYYEHATFINYIRETFYEGELYEQIENAYVIFEVDDLLKEEIVSTTVTFSDILFDIFYTMKENNCKIMFICGTDETRFERYSKNAFLDYVDIHINKDIYTIFLWNIFHNMEDECGGSMISNCTFILGENISENVLQGCQYNIFFNEYFLPYISERFSGACTNASQMNMQLLRNYNIDVFCNTMNDNAISTYYSPIYEYNVVLDTDFYFSELQNTHACAIGKEINEDDGDFMDLLSDRRLLGREYPIYIYDSTNYFLLPITIPNAYEAEVYEDLIPDILLDFLSDEDLTQYDNWSGRCNITYKVITPGDGGWLKDLAEEGEAPIVTWSIYSSEDDEAIYYPFIFL